MAQSTMVPRVIQVSVPDGQSGDWKVEGFKVSEAEASFAKMRSWFRPLEYIEAGEYKRLMRRGTVVMSNTPMERDTNLPILCRAKGRVLINGLGLGMVLAHILKKPEVTEVVVVEISKDVISLVGPSYQNDSRVKIVNADALKYKAQGAFDYVWHDIWDTICASNLPTMKTLTRKYGRKAAWQGCWCRAECEAVQ